MKNYLLGIDIGTSGAKIIILDTDKSGEIAVSVTKTYELYTPKPLWAEQEPTHWWQATVSGIKEAMARIDAQGSDIKAVGLTGQMHSSVFLDENNNSIRKAMLWCDQRTAAECAQITSIIGADRLVDITCNPVLTGFTAPKITWLKNNEPENYKKLKKVLLPKDYIRFLLTGEYATDVSDASGMAIFDVKNRCWSDEIIDGLGFKRDWFGKVYESPEITGKISKEAANLTGLSEGTPVVAGGGDNAASAIGNGIVEPGMVSNSLGTSGVVFAYADQPVIDKNLRVHTFCHAVPGKWHVMGVMLSAGGSLRWYRDTFCDTERYIAEYEADDPYNVISRGAAEIPLGSEGLIFLPYLSGERCPHPDPNARGVFFGATLRHTRKHFSRSVFEGISYGLNDSFEILKEMNIPIDTVIATGGGARSDFFRSVLADITGYDHCTMKNDEGPSYGAAILAGVGAGIYDDVVEASKANAAIVNKNKTNADNHKEYQKYIKTYKDLYPALKPIFDSSRPTD